MPRIAPVREFCTSLVLQQTKSHEPKKQAKRHRREDAATVALGKRFHDAPYRLPSIEPVEELFRHSGWRIERERVRRALRAVHAPEARIERFEACGGDCVAQWSPGRQRHRLKANYCGDRFCVPCCRARSNRARRKLHKLCSGHSPLFLTFTLRASSAPLSDLISKLIESFAKLRRHKLWSERVTAGAYVIEVKRGTGSGAWHPHIHVLALGRFMPQAELSDAWKEASGGSFIVDVQRVSADDRAVGYVGKYIAKGWTAEVARDHDSLVECVAAMRGRRMLSTFGEWHGLEPDVDEDGPDDWHTVGRLVSIHYAAQRSEPWAVGVLRSLKWNPDESAPPPGESDSTGDSPHLPG